MGNVLKQVGPISISPRWILRPGFRHRARRQSIGVALARPPPKVNEIIAQLDIGKPVVVTLLLGERFYDPAGGIVVVGSGDANTDWHAVVAVGHGEDGADAFILVRNSWGSGWGLKGH